MKIAVLDKSTRQIRIKVNIEAPEYMRYLEV